jgi:hypothetical protein
MIKFVGVSPEDFFFVQGFISEKGVTPVPVIRVRGGIIKKKWRRAGRLVGGR